MTHENLNRIVEDADEALNYAWSRRRECGRILLLAHGEREDANNLCVECWTKGKVGKGEMDLQRLRCGEYWVGLQTLPFLDHLAGCGVQKRAASRELRSFASFPPGIVAPLFVLHPSGHWATLWSPQASGSLVLRYNPCTGQAEHN
jgi:hypothetical protein